MRNIITIVRRDLGAYFTSPIGYIFMIVFVLISVGLFITSFFTFPVADLRAYFMNLPILLCVFIPAVTMRVWAEERKENTWEMLLTFPMRARELVLGKFLACLIFYAITVAATFTMPLMLVLLGNPDNGGLAGGYLGTLFLGAYFLAIGIFFSGFFKDQIVAFVVTLLACFGIFLLGTDFIASYIDGMFETLALGSLLGQLVGMSDHYNSFTRGVVELADMLYFVAWTLLFLVLNVMYIDGRNRPHAKTIFAAAVSMCVVIGLLLNWLITGASLGRWDMTEDKIYTVCDASTRILSNLDAPVQVKVYITPKGKMPTGLTDLEQDISDKLDELRIASGGKIQFSSVYLEVANVLADTEKADDEEESEEEAIEKRMLDKGVEPFSVRAMSQDEVTNKLVYSSIGIGYKDKKEEILPQIMPQAVEQLEYRLVSAIHKLTREKLPVVALVAPKEAINIDAQTRAMLMQMGQPIPQSDDPYVYLEQLLQYEKYEVKRTDLTEDSPMPDEYDTLAVVNPRELNDRQRWEINRALVSGKPVILAVQNYEWDYRPTRTGTSVNKREENPGVNELLENYGLGISDDILMDSNHVPLTMQSGNPLANLMGGGQTVNLAIHILVNNTSMDQNYSVTSRLSSIFYLWGSHLTLDEDALKKHGLNAEDLMWTTDRAWTVPADAKLTSATFEEPDEGDRYTLMAMVTGQFPDAHEGGDRPDWPEDPPPRPGEPPRPPKPDVEEAEATPIVRAPGKLILLGCSQMFRKNFMQAGNLDLFLNCVDALTLGDDLINVRGRKPIQRAIDMPSPAKRRLWKFINYALATTIIAAVGIVSATTRRRARNAYTMAHGYDD